MNKDRTYGYEWAKIRTQYIKSSPKCVRCNYPAQIVDHIRPVKDGGSNHFTNLQSLCRICHGVKTGRDVTVRRRKKRKPIPKEVVSVTGVWGPNY